MKTDLVDFNDTLVQGFSIRSYKSLKVYVILEGIQIESCVKFDIEPDPHFVGLSRVCFQLNICEVNQAQLYPMNHLKLDIIKGEL